MKVSLKQNREADRSGAFRLHFVSTLVPLTFPVPDLERREPPRTRYQCDRGTSGEPLRGALHREGVRLHRVLHRPFRDRWSVPLGQGRRGGQPHGRPRVEVARRESRVTWVGGTLCTRELGSMIRSPGQSYIRRQFLADKWRFDD